MISLTAFHIFFVSLSVLTAFFFGVWAVFPDGARGSLLFWLGILSMIAGVFLFFYLMWFIRKTRAMPKK
ncbi:MAG: hypothetical protein HY592_05400 [Candidatus Omnitrophica bacterium]|nr:hypothetical protein [Candidatus Omnitrophota bacterium]